MSHSECDGGYCYEFQIVDDQTLLVKYFHPLGEDIARFFDIHRDEIAEVAGWQNIFLSEEEVELLRIESSEINSALDELDTSECLFILTRIPETRKPPYLVHTGHEIALMEAKIKPLSVFTEYASAGGGLIDSIFEAFKAGVAEFGWQWRRYSALDLSYSRDDAVDTLLFCLPGEEWRVDSYILLKSFASAIGQCDEVITMQGILLGYEYWQMRYHLENLRERQRDD